MQLVIKSVLARRLLMVLVSIIFLAVVGWIAKACVAYELSRKPTVKNLELAARLDPGNADYHLMLGRLYQYNVADLEPDKALEHFRRAAELSPSNPRAWVDLAAALEFQGKISESEACLRRADFLAPNLPAFQWPIANFYLLHGNIDEAFRHFKVVLAGTSEYDGIVFSTAWKASGDPDKILEQLIPRRAATEFSYLYFHISQQRFTEAQSVWKRIMSESEKFTAQQAAGYIDSLITARRPGDAYQVWRDLQSKGLARSPATGTQENLLANGDFEDELLRMGFDWRIAPVEGVYAGLDTAAYHSPSHALLVQFSGKQNVDCRNVYQYVKVSPGRRYRLQAFLKTEGITTDSGPRLEVRDAYDPGALEKFSENLIGNTDGWTLFILDFETGPKTELVIVGLARLPSRKFDNLIAGKVWLDDGRLSPLPE
jgi:hypothetical protein